MNQEKRFSDEFLNAFVDDQLAADEKSRAYIEIGQHEGLNRQVCELRKLHDLVQLAYRNPPAPPARPVDARAARRARLRFGVAASVLLALGGLLGAQIVSLRSNIPAPAATADADARHTARMSKVLIHVTDDNTAHLDDALKEIEGLLSYYRDQGQSARVEVVMNGRGLNLVRAETSAFAGRIQRLQQDYPNLTFAACQNTIELLQRDQGVTVQLLPGVIVIDSGMAEIMRRQSQGWTYLQV